MKKLNITLIGGGNSSHTIIPLLSNSGHSVSLYTRNPEKWSKNVTMEYTNKEGKVIDSLIGKLKYASNKPQEIIPDSDIIILSLPVSVYRLMLQNIAPYINKKRDVYIGVIYGQGGFNWMMNNLIAKFNLNNLIYFSVGLLPWITRTKEYGKIGINYGPKKNNVIALNNKDEFNYLNEVILNDLCFSYFKTGKFRLADTFLSLTLSVDNQIIHLSRLYSLYLQYGGRWKSLEDVPLFYRDFDDLSAKIMEELDLDYTKIRCEIKKKFPDRDFTYMLDYLNLERLSYGSSNTNIKKSFINSPTLGQIPTPVVREPDGFFVFDKNHRFFKDDLYYGLVIAKWFADKLNIDDTPMLNQIINWSQNYLNDIVMIDNKLIVPSNINDYKYGHPDIYEFKSFEDYIF